LKYLVKWKGYPNQTNWTWEPEEKILQDNRDEFHEKYPNAPRQVDIQKIHFRERLVEDESTKQGWMNGRLTPEDEEVEETGEDTYVPISLEFPEQFKMVEYRNYLMPNIK
jgi:hypothetical protein